MPQGEVALAENVKPVFKCRTDANGIILLSPNERSKKFPERRTTRIIVISASLCEEGEQIKELREAEQLQMHIWPA